MPNQPATTPRRRKRSWFYKCCRCCSGQADDGDWGPAPGEVPGARGTNPIIREGMLVVSGINMMSGRGGRNRCDHHTDEYEYDNLIVRRGQPFNIKLQFQQEYDPEDHRVCLEFLIVGKEFGARQRLEVVAKFAQDQALGRKRFLGPGGPTGPLL
uniref:Uncharacterized protein n=1 Tax=Sphaerodactylus townsendi TaxID=933632 RepID=A0ACB8EWZ0_9SAUR